MEGIVQNIVNLTGKKDEYEALRGYLNSNVTTVQRHAVNINRGLQLLDPAKYSAGWCFLLHVKQATALDKYFMDQVETLFEHMDVEQIRCGFADRFGAVAHSYTEECQKLKTPVRGILPLQMALLKLQPSPDHITPLHADFVCLCLLAKHYSFPTSVLSEVVYEVRPQETGITPRDMQLYYYYGGMVWIGLKEFSKAVSFLETAVSIYTSAIAVEAYKKLVLVSLLHTGKQPVCSKHTGLKLIRRYCKDYDNLATLYLKPEVTNQTVAAFVAQNAKTFQEDKNYGLALQAQEARTLQTIARLTSTYNTLSLENIAAQAGLEGPEEAEAKLLEMVGSGQIRAHINDSSKMVSFVVEESEDLTERLAEELEKVKKMAMRIEAAEESLLCSKDYIMKQIQRDPASKEELAWMGASSSKGVFSAVMDALNC